MWQFAEAVRGLSDGCRELGIPVTGGNVSFYNSTGATAIHPTPVIGVLGLLEKVADRIPMGFGSAGDPVLLLGETREELSGSEWAHVVHGHLGGSPPAVDLAGELRLAGVLAEAARSGHLAAAHDLSDGGLAQALVEACLRRGLGAHVTLPDDLDPFVYLFSESTARVLVAVRRGQEVAFEALATERGIPCRTLGTVRAPGTPLTLAGPVELPLDELREAHTGTLPRLLAS
jgi:phosphoribosylformylglycinamidine synthase